MKLLQKNKRCTCTWSQDTYMSVLMCQGYIPPKKMTEGLLMKLLKKNKIKINLNTELKEMGVFSAVAGNHLPNQLQKKNTTGSLPPAVPLAITPTFSPWTHTSDDSYIYQLSLVLATAIVSFSSFPFSISIWTSFVLILSFSCGYYAVSSVSVSAATRLAHDIYASLYVRRSHLFTFV